MHLLRIEQRELYGQQVLVKVYSPGPRMRDCEWSVVPRSAWLRTAHWISLDAVVGPGYAHITGDRYVWNNRLLPSNAQSR